MRSIFTLTLGAALVTAVLAQTTGTTVTAYKGNFKWIKIGQAPGALVHSLATASVLKLDLSFPNQVQLRKDAHGFQWFTFILADQGKDWKWNQTASGSVPATGGVIRPGRYTVTIPLKGIPSSVLKSSVQVLSLGPGTSGLVRPITFTIVGIHGA